jgi:hypothetical protein
MRTKRRRYLRLSALFLGGLVAFLPAFASVRSRSYLARIKVGMSEEEVFRALGREPDDAGSAVGIMGLHEYDWDQVDGSTLYILLERDRVTKIGIRRPHDLSERIAAICRHLAAWSPGHNSVSRALR